MEGNDKAVLLYSTFPTLEDAERVGGHLVDARLAACVNIIPGMVSIYHWEGARHRDSEVAVLIKTRAGLAERVVSEVRERHPYANPALVVLPVEGGSDDYLAWILTQTGDAGITPRG